MLSKIPISPDRVADKDIDREILRAGIIAELDAINLYEQMAAKAKDDHIRRVLLDVAREEKTHAGEFQTLLLRLDSEHRDELEKGRREVEEMLGALE